MLQKCFLFLGIMILSPSLVWAGHFENVFKKVSQGVYQLKTESSIRVVFNYERDPSSVQSTQDPKVRLEELKKERTSFATHPKISNWTIAGSGIEEDGKQKWILLQGSYQKPNGETEKFYEIHYLQSNKSRVAAVTYPANSKEEDVKSAVNAVRTKLKEQ